MGPLSMDRPKDSDDSSAQLRVRQGSRMREGASMRPWSYYQRRAKAMTELADEGLGFRLVDESVPVVYVDLEEAASRAPQRRLG